MTLLDRRSFLHASLAASVISPVHGSEADKKKAVASFHIGLADSLVNGQLSRAVAPVFVQSMANVFAVKDKPHAQIQIEHSVALAKQLLEDQLQLAIMPGIEYGWLGPMFAKLTPIATVFTSDIRLKACLVAHADMPVKSLLDLAGKTIALPKKSQFHTHVFLHHALAKLGAQPSGFFDNALITGDVNEGIECVVDKEATAVLVDMDSWQGYQERKPGRAKKLTMIAQSEAFPTAAVLHHPENWKADDLKQMKEALYTAHQKPFSRQILNFWRISKFVPHSAEYEQVVKHIVREIPQPVVPAVFARDQRVMMP